MGSGFWDYMKLLSHFVGLVELIKELNYTMGRKFRLDPENLVQRLFSAKSRASEPMANWGLTWEKWKSIIVLCSLVKTMVQTIFHYSFYFLDTVKSDMGLKTVGLEPSFWSFNHIHAKYVIHHWNPRENTAIRCAYVPEFLVLDPSSPLVR